MKKVYLVVDEKSLSSVALATTDQFQAQQVCHRVARLTNVPQAVVCKCWFDLPFGFRIELRKLFSKYLQWEEKL